MTQFKAALIGAGKMGQIWADTLEGSGRVEIVAWVDTNVDAVRAGIGKVRIEPRYVGADLGRAIELSGPDFVLDASPPSAHFDNALVVLSARLPLLSEKPMSDEMERAREMVLAAERADTLYVVSQNYRFAPQLATFKHLMSDHLDRIEMLDCQFFRGPRFTGFRLEMANPLLLDIGIHAFDLARYLTSSDPVSVYCEQSSPSWNWFQGPANATALFEFTGGLRFTYHGSECADGLETSWSGSWRAVGKGGTSTWDGVGAPIAETVSPDTTSEMQRERHEPRLVADSDPHGTQASLAAFLDALEGGPRPMTECHDNIRSLAMVFAAIESSAIGKRVAVQW